METTKNLMASSLSTGKSSSLSHSLQASTCTAPNQTIPGTPKKVVGTTLKVNELARVLHSWKSIAMASERYFLACKNISILKIYMTRTSGDRKESVFEGA
ncbi:hypothetical protein NC651_029702 [Populus alba x Populus x berolinensis]|nr:hypothetical protein NC651_029691 [Populus alba x Populus x berolinensis]KAJ6876776.1 hypothetical protein NC651_029702 [Populus alba x Populus x berolinensis]